MQDGLVVWIDRNERQQATRPAMGRLPADSEFFGAVRVSGWCRSGRIPGAGRVVRASGVSSVTVKPDPGLAVNWKSPGHQAAAGGSCKRGSILLTQSTFRLRHQASALRGPAFDAIAKAVR